MKIIEIVTKLGTIKGYQENDINFFKGIPYAKTERFKKPQAYEFKDNYFDATKDEVECPQHKSYFEAREDEFYRHEFQNPDKVYKYDESYMTLNIIAPANKTNMDTLVFIHGGSFTGGCQSDLPYGLSTKYAKKGIILVSLSYRLNIFASFNSDNLALHDLTFALKWVKDNIESFGGNKKIIMSGQSAGAFLVQDLLYSSNLKGIVDGAIMLSGGGIIPYFLGPNNKTKYKKYFDGFIKSLGLNSEDDLLKLSTEELFKKEEEYNAKNNGLMVYMPQVDNDTIKDYPRKLIKRKDTLDIPLIYGITKDDMFPPILLLMAKNHARYHYKNKMNNVYLYFFKRESPGDNAKAFHACDMAYAFGFEKLWRPYQDIDYKISEQMVEYFSNFVHTLNPNDISVPEWKPFYPTKELKSFDEDLVNNIRYKKALKICSKFTFFPKVENKEN